MIKGVKMIKIFFSESSIIQYLEKKGYIVQKKSEKRKKAIQKAREDRSRKIQERIQKAIQEMKEQGIDINAHKLSKYAKVNYRTALKYLKS